MKKTGRWINYALWVTLLTCLAQFSLVAQELPTALQTNLGDLEVGNEWIYGELDQAIARAKENGKPLFVLFR